MGNSKNMMVQVQESWDEMMERQVWAGHEQTSTRQTAQILFLFCLYVSLFPYYLPTPPSSYSHTPFPTPPHPVVFVHG